MRLTLSGNESPIHTKCKCKRQRGLPLSWDSHARLIGFLRTHGKCIAVEEGNYAGILKVALGNLIPFAKAHMKRISRWKC